MNVEDLRQSLAEAARRTDIDTVNALAEVHTRTRRRRRQRRLTSAAIFTSALFAAAALVALVVSVQRGGTGRPRIIVPVSSPTSTPQRSTALSLIGSWQPQSIAGYSGLLTSPPLSTVPFVTFYNPNSWTGSDGCNGLGGSYHLAPQGGFRLVGTILQTLMNCHDQTPTAAVFKSATRVEVTDRQLIFLAGDGRTLAQYRRINNRPVNQAECGVADLRPQNEPPPVRPYGVAVVAQVPTTLPTGGVIIPPLMVLMPPRTDDHPRISQAHALQMARTYGNPQAGPSTNTLLARFTDYGAGDAAQLAAPRLATSPPNTEYPADATAKVNRLAWVIVQTYPAPINNSQSPFGGKSCVTHHQIIIDALDGRFLLGTSTP
ncbi:MAG: META domain-containing protein [Actinomycetota bacterium]|nr:META domain-containing protein [Actinomycetota bacterium]